MVGPARPSSDDETPSLARPGQKRSTDERAPGKKIKSAAEKAISAAVTPLTSPKKIEVRGIKRAADPDMAESLSKMQERPLPANLLELSPAALKHFLEVFAKCEVDVDTITNWVSLLDVAELAKRSDLVSFKEIFRIAERKCPSELHLFQNAELKIQQAIGIHLNALAVRLGVDSTPETVRRAINDAFTFSVPDFMQINNLNELENAVQKIFDEHCKGIGGYLKSWSGHTFEGRCALLLESIQTAKIEDEREVQELLRSRRVLKDIQQDKLLPIFLETTREERATLATHLEFLLKHIVNDEYILSSILNDLKKVPRDERVEALGHVRSLPEKDRIGRSILNVLRETSRSGRAELVRLVHTLMTGLSGYYEQEGIVTTLGVIPEDERGETVQLAGPFLRGVGTSNERVSVLHNVTAIPRGEREEILKLVEPLLVDITVHDQARVFSALAVMSSREERVQFVTVLRDVTAGLDPVSKNVLLTTACTLSTVVLQLVQPLLVRFENGYDRYNILNIVTEIPFVEREEVLRQAQPFLIGLERSHELINMLIAIKQIPRGERKEVLRLAQPLLVGFSLEKIAMLNAISEIPQDDREEVLRLARPLLERVEGDRGFSIVRALTEISQRKEILRLAEPWAKGMTDGFELASLLRAIAKIPESEREEMLRVAAPWLEACVIGQGFLLSTIADMHPDKRDEVLRLAESFVLEIRDGEERAKILLAIAEISPKEEVLRLASSVWMELKDRGRADIVRTIAEIPPDQREGVLQLAQLVWGGVEHSGQQAKILSAIALIPQDQRGELVRQVRHLVVDLENGDQRVDILQAVSEVSQDEREEVLRLAQRLFVMAVDGYARAVILRLVAEMPQAERDQTVTALIALITGVDPREAKELFVLACQLPAEQRRSIIETVTALPPEQRLVGVSREHSRIRASINNYRITRTKYSIDIKRQELTESPRLALHNLTELFSREVRLELGITFLGEPGIDASGLGREFISLLFNELKNAMKFKLLANGLCRPLQPVDAKMNNGEKQSYNEIGKLMLFCLAAVREYPIGMIFDESVFVALKALVNSAKLVSGEFTFDELFAVYTEMNSNNDEDVAKIKLMNQSLASCADEASLQEARSDILDGYVQPVLAPLIEIAKGLKNAPFNKDALNLDATSLSEKLQGKVTREYILSKLEFTGFSDEKATWMRNWISNTSNEKMRQFLHAMTGASALGKANLKIANRGESIYFHTCFNSLDIPLDAIENEEMFRVSLESAIVGRAGFSRS